MKKTIVLDVDGVMVDFLTGYIAYIHSLGHTHVWPDKIKSFLFLHGDFGFTPKDSYDIFRSFTKSGGFRNLAAYPGVDALLKALKEEDFKVILATNVPTAGQDDRIHNLRELGIEYDDIVFGPDKFDVARVFDAGIIVDDHPDTLLHCLAQESGIVIARPLWVYNEHVEHPKLECLGPHPGAMEMLTKFIRGYSSGASLG